MKNNMENSNIFENAKFGDRYVTRDGRLALYVERNSYDEEYPHSLLVEDYKNDTLNFADDGSFDSYDDLADKHPTDIVSHYQEPIDEEKLDELAKESEMALVNNLPHNPIDWEYIRGFKSGYRKAKEE